MPGVGIKTTARLLTEVAGKPFSTAGYLASFARLTPVSRPSGPSIRREHLSGRGSKVLKRALVLSALEVLRDPVSRAYHDRKIPHGNRHNEALVGLARRRWVVLNAVLRNVAPYAPPVRQVAIAA